MPETKKYCTSLPEEVIKISETNPKTTPFVQAGIYNGEEGLGIDKGDEPGDSELLDITGLPGLPATSQSTCETHPKSIGCKVLGDQFIYAIQGLITDLESTKPPGYILAIGKLKGAILKLQAGN